MTRRILCDACGSKWEPHKQDMADGWKHRLLALSVKKPESHGIRVFTGDVFSNDPTKMNLESSEQLPSILCDSCGEPIADGDMAIAISMSNKDDFYHWEHEYGTVLSDEAYKVAKTLAKP
jgi:hypothetical protein